MTTTELLTGVRAWVEIESHTADCAGVNAMADRVAADYAARGASVERVPGRDGFGDHLIARAPWARVSNAPGVLILSHIDTVHPRGTLARFPFRVDGDRAFGPGIYDMKGGAYIAMDAVGQIAAAGGAALPVTHLFVSDEEVGSPTSRDLIVDLARAAKYVLVTEPARDGGCVVTARKGVMRYDVAVHGRPAHAGARHQDGISAIRELARIVLAFEALTDHARGITCNVGQIGGGSGVNVVPALAWAGVDVRAPDAAAVAAVEAFVAGLKPEHPEARIVITGGLNRPPYERRPEIARLFDHARAVAAEMGLELRDVATGGGSDGNFTAALAPTLDGLGVDGRGAHTEDEQMRISSLVERRDLMRRLLESLS